jgi:hypothetical protein
MKEWLNKNSNLIITVCSVVGVFAYLEHKFDRIDDKFDRIDDKFIAMNDKFEIKFDEVNVKLSELDKELSNIRTVLILKGIYPQELGVSYEK